MTDAYRWQHIIPATRPGDGNFAFLFELYTRDAEWMVDGLCAQVDREMWFPEPGNSTARPKRVCMACPVRSECREYALSHDEAYGVWGGLSTLERQALAGYRAGWTPERTAERFGYTARTVERALQRLARQDLLEAA